MKSNGLTTCQKQTQNVSIDTRS